MTNKTRRRNFLAGLAATTGGAFGAAALASAAAAETAVEATAPLKITAAKMILLIGKDRQRSLYLKLETESGLEGLYGPIDEEAAVFVDRYFSRPLRGRDGLEFEAYWDAMFKASRHSRGSHYLMGLSAVDNALWDLRARHFGVPVYKLLGGSRRSLRAYASCLGFSQERAAMRAKARELKEEGYRHQKWFLNQRGPAAGPEGLKQDVETFLQLRDAVGDDVDLMIDASKKWDLQYAAAWCKRVEALNPLWLEEPFPSAKIDAFVNLSRETSVPIATGEHFYGRWDAFNFLKGDAIRVVQADPEWCGGVSELVKICTLASVFGANVIPHGHSMHAAMHVVAAQPIEVCPLVEFLIQKMTGNYYYFERHVPKPVNGVLELSDRPGFGIELDESRIVEKREAHWNLTEGPMLS